MTDDRGLEKGNWRVASYSAQQGNCVEFAADPGDVAIRDTKDRAGGMLELQGQSWTAFLAAVTDTA